jgi:hypothetical protein
MGATASKIKPKPSSSAAGHKQAMKQEPMTQDWSHRPHQDPTLKLLSQLQFTVRQTSPLISPTSPAYATMNNRSRISNELRDLNGVIPKGRVDIDDIHSLLGQALTGHTQKFQELRERGVSEQSLMAIQKYVNVYQTSGTVREGLIATWAVRGQVYQVKSKGEEEAEFILKANQQRIK